MVANSTIFGSKFHDVAIAVDNKAKHKSLLSCSVETCYEKKTTTCTLQVLRQLHTIIYKVF